ncbi:unnamed protein product [Orchesella dallaii]|uniref:Barrier-to-autointegration factor n=1 Tax=Orchesella dallaii TaxID=48710 RepID=A0ABP1R6I4_9HEXA
MNSASFICEPMRDKLVTSIPGVTPIYGQRLAAQGFEKASALLGKYLVLSQDEGPFVDWLKIICGASTDDAKIICLNLRQWCHNFLGPCIETPVPWHLVHHFD